MEKSLQVDKVTVDNHIEPSVNVHNELFGDGNTAVSIDRETRAPSTTSRFDFSISMNLGRASQNHSIHSNQNDHENEGTSSRSNLPP